MGTERLSPELRQRIETILAEHETVLFMKGSRMLPQCGFSARVVQVLKEVGASYHAVNVLADPEIREGIKIFGDWPTIPQLYHRGELLGGCDVVSGLHADGRLPALLGPG